MIAVVLVARNIRVRKHDIESRYDLEQAQRRHEQLSLTDPLTGALNRRFLDNNYAQIVAQAVKRDQRVVLVLLDIDQFKPLNDTYGHHCGDSVLKQLVRILQDNLPGDSLVIRLGGDEFAVLFHGKECRKQIDRCLRHLETDPAVLRATEGRPVRVSAGYAIAADGQSHPLEEIYRHADESLYAAKRGYRPERTEVSLPPRREAT